MDPVRKKPKDQSLFLKDPNRKEECLVVTMVLSRANSSVLGQLIDVVLLKCVIYLVLSFL